MLFENEWAKEIAKKVARYVCSAIPENGSAAYNDTEHNFPIIYGDYYFAEAILKLCSKELFMWG